MSGCSRLDMWALRAFSARFRRIGPPVALAREVGSQSSSSYVRCQQRGHFLAREFSGPVVGRRLLRSDLRIGVAI